MKKKTAIISSVLGTVLGTSLGAGFLYKAGKEKDKKLKDIIDVNCKNDAILKLFAKWMKLKQNGKSIAGYLKDNGYKTVAIYGMHYLGECLLNELKDSEIEVKYAIDRNAWQITADVDVITLDDNLLEVDAIIVTAFWFFDTIEDELFKIADYPVLSLEEIISEMEYEA